MSFRVAISCDDGPLFAWEAACIDRLEREGSTIEAVVIRDGPTRVPGPHVKRLRSHHVVEPPASMGRAHRTTTVPTGIDAVVAFGNADVKPSAADFTAFGVWSFRFGVHAAADASDGLAIDEILQGDAVVGAQLVRDGVVAMKSGFFETAPHSHDETVDAVCFGAASWPAHVVREIKAGLEPEALPVAPASLRVPSRSPATRIAFATKVFLSSVALRLHYLFRHEHWNVGIVRRPIASFAAGGVVRDVEWLPSPRTGRFAADPFGIVEDGSINILCEEFDYRERRGFLSASVVRERQQAPPWRPVLREAQHLSYPYLIERDGKIYCIPESSEADEVAIHEAVDFPYSWRRCATLLPRFSGADSTVFEHEGRWWLLCTGLDGPNRCLYAWHAPDLLGPWRPHARNPVKIDPRSARPAGTPFVSDGRLYRPAQDCSGAYGRRVSLMHVRTLTPTDFDEERVAYVEPDAAGPWPDGLHTLSGAGGVTLVDGKRYRFVPREFARVFAQYVRAVASAVDLAPKGKVRT